MSEFKEQLLYATSTKQDRILEFSCGKCQSIIDLDNMSYLYILIVFLL